MAAAPAGAEVGGQVSLFSQSRFRGYSLSAGRPTATIDLSYDDDSGFYAAASGSLVASAHHGIDPLGLQLDVGYAKRLRSGVTLDAGVIHSRYSRDSRYGAATSYTEVYAGLSYKFLSSRVAFSPRYFQSGRRTVYGELNADVSPASRLHLNAHAGLLVPITYADVSGSGTAQYDWRIGLSRDIGHVALHLIGSGGGPARDSYRGRGHSRNALVVGVSWAL